MVKDTPGYLDHLRHVIIQHLIDAGKIAEQNENETHTLLEGWDYNKLLGFVRDKGLEKIENLILLEADISFQGVPGQNVEDQTLEEGFKDHDINKGPGSKQVN